MPYAIKKDADQSAHPCSLTGVFVIRSLDSKMPIDANALASFCSWADRLVFYLRLLARLWRHVFPDLVHMMQLSSDDKVELKPRITASGTVYK